ncbi:hypothetical protein, partial [Paracoccus siganidrum]|uniref:hypothetical protein n=1 Tax=Paracoccus siganidrum TaxID=1276757 RepID=UPI00197D2486
LHAVDPPALPATAEREKVDDFYTARSSTKPPLPWTNFAPPFSPPRQVTRRLALRASASVTGSPTSSAEGGFFLRSR